MIRFLFVVVFAFTLVGCAGLQPKADEQIVMERAHKRMAALQELDFNTAYSYMSAGYRAKKTLDRFKAEFAGASSLVAFEVLDATCDVDTCIVRVSRDVSVSVHIPGMDRSKPLNTVSQQVWVKSDTHWGYVKLK